MSKQIMSIVVGFFFGWSAHSASSAPAASGLTVSGFLDVQHQWGRGIVELNATNKLDGDATGFLVNQGAMVLSDEFEVVEMMIDIPFRSGPRTTSATGADTTNSDLILATEEAQAYLKYQHDNGMFMQLGQFDSYFGIESNDSIDILFPTHGILHDLTPNTHTGLLMGYSFIPFYIHAMVANANSATRQPSDRSAEFSLRLGWSQEPVQASFGVAYTNSNGTYLLNGVKVDFQPSMLFNAIVQTRISKLELGAEVDVLQSRLGDAERGSGRTDHDLVFGYLGQAMFNLTNKTALGIRYEYIKNDESNEFVQAAQAGNTATTLTGQGGYLSRMTFGSRYLVNEELMVKAGVDLMNLNIGVDAPSEGKTQSWVQAAVGAVYDF